MNIGIARWLLIGVLFLFGCLLVMASKTLFADRQFVSLTLDLLGGFLVVAIPVAIVHESIFKRAEQQEHVHQIEDLFERKIASVLVNAKRYGLDQMRDSLNVQQLFDALGANDELLWLDTFSPGQKQWLDNLERAIDRGAIVRMLVIEPSSNVCVWRAEEIGGYYKPERFKAELQIFVDDLKAVALSSGTRRGTLEIIFYDDLLGIPLYIVYRGGKPYCAYSSFYLTKPTGVGFPHFRWIPGELPVIEWMAAYVREKMTRHAHTAVSSNQPTKT